MKKKSQIIGCGKEHKSRKILYKLRDDYYQFPQCPICHSIALKKISRTSSTIFGAYDDNMTSAIFETYDDKTYKCNSCGHRF